MSAFLLDTNIICELLEPKPEPKVTTWIDATDEGLLFLSVLTLGERSVKVESSPQCPPY